MAKYKATTADAKKLTANGRNQPQRYGGTKEERREAVAHRPTDPSTRPYTLHPTPYTLAVVLAGAAILVASLWGGTIYDRFNIGADYPGTMDLTGVPLVEILAGLAVAAALWRARRLRVTVPAAGFGLLFLWCALSLLRSAYPYASAEALAMLGAALAIGAAVSSLVRVTGLRLGIAGAIVSAASVIAAQGISQYLPMAMTGNTAWRVFGPFEMPNFLAGYLAMALPLTAALFLVSRVRALAVLSGLGLLLQSACLLLTGSRLGLAAAALAMVVFGVGAARAGAFRGEARRWAIALLAVATVACLLGARPVLRRVLNAGSESYSARFRELTWRGTASMARAHPLLGTGLATFDTAYPPYARVGYTRHAHQTYLQLAAESGIPSLLFLVVGVGGTLAVGFRAIWHRPPAESDSVVEGDEEPDSGVSPVMEGRLLLAGALAGVAGAVIHNLFDCDFYVAGDLILFAALCGVCLGIARTLAGESGPDRAAAQPESKISLMRGAACAAAALLLIEGGRQALARVDAAEAAKALVSGDGQAAAQAYEGAAAMDGGNADYHLDLAQAYGMTGRLQEADSQYRRATELARIGKTYYRYGKYLLAAHRPIDAVTAFERARRLDGLYLKNLLALADAYRATDQPARADQVYRDMEVMYHGPLEQVRAVPEVVEWEYGVAGVSLADSMAAAGDRVGAEASYRYGCGILLNFWDNRRNPMVWGSARPEDRDMFLGRLTESMGKWADLLDSLGRHADAESVRARRTRFESERQAQSTPD